MILYFFIYRVFVRVDYYVGSSDMIRFKFLYKMGIVKGMIYGKSRKRIKR